MGIASSESAGAGNAVVLSAPAGAPHTNHVMIDVNCAVKTAVNGRVVTNPHSTHWIGTD